MIVRSNFHGKIDGYGNRPDPSYLYNPEDEDQQPSRSSEVPTDKLALSFEVSATQQPNAVHATVKLSSPALGREPDLIIHRQTLQTVNYVSRRHF